MLCVSNITPVGYYFAVSTCIIVLQGMGRGVRVRWLQRQTMVSVVLALRMRQKLEVMMYAVVAFFVHLHMICLENVICFL